MKKTRLSLLITLPVLVAACKTTDTQLPEPVVIAPPAAVLDCVPISTLIRVEIPAETKTITAVTQIDNPPYEPIERREQQTRVVKEAYTIYVDGEGKIIDNTCPEPEPEPDPAPESVSGTVTETP